MCVLLENTHTHTHLLYELKSFEAAVNKWVYFNLNTSPIKIPDYLFVPVLWCFTKVPAWKSVNAPRKSVAPRNVSTSNKAAAKSFSNFSGPRRVFPLMGFTSFRCHRRATGPSGFSGIVTRLKSRVQVLDERCSWNAFLGDDMFVILFRGWGWEVFLLAKKQN